MTNSINHTPLPATAQGIATQGASDQAIGVHPSNGAQVQALPGGGQALQDQLPKGTLSPLAKLGLAKFGAAKFDDWSKAQGAFRSLIGEFATKGDEGSYKKALQLCEESFPLLKADQLPFRVDRKIVNLLESKLKAEFDPPAASISGSRITELADMAIRKASVRYGETLDAAMNAILETNGAFEPEEEPRILQYLMHLACTFSTEGTTYYHMFKLEVANLRGMDRQERIWETASIEEDLPIDLDPSPLIHSLENIPFGESSQKMLAYQGRCLAAVKFGEITISFYMSSGQSPKQGVEKGRWYPIFGIGPKTGWLNKADEVGQYYGSGKLRKIADLLDADFGDLRYMDNDILPGTVDDQILPPNTLEFINKDMPACDLLDYEDKVINGEYMTAKIVYLLHLLECKPAERRNIAAELAKLDVATSRFSKRPDWDPSRQKFFEQRRNHYLGVQDPIAISPKRTAESNEQKS